VVDAFTREALVIDVDQGIEGDQVVEVMTSICTRSMVSRPSPISGASAA
jgi:hypothetical protein